MSPRNTGLRASGGMMRRLTVDRSHGGNAAPGILDLSASLNPLGPPPEAIAAYHLAASSITAYPAPGAPELTARLADWLGVKSENIVAGNGTTHLLYLIARVLRPRRPFVVIPTFSEIANGLIAAGAAPSAILTRREEEFALASDAVSRALEAGADAIFLGRPNNPTGVMLDAEQAAAIARECSRRNAYCVFDEAFIDFAGPALSAATLIRKFKHLIVLRSLTKIFAIPGLRVGCLAAGRATAAAMRERIEPWSVNQAAERVAIACLDAGPGYLARTREVVGAERDRLAGALAKIPRFTVFRPSANFVMFEVGAERAAQGFARHMLERGVAVRDLATMAGCGPGFYRVAVGLRGQNRRALSAAADYRVP